MGKALYRKYRSKKLSEIVGQEHITTTLSNALKKGTISHAYLFTGPRGVGKTSIARILAHEVNNLPYSDDTVHLDIIEIDAASNRRIDEIRELREKVHNAPTSARYKVYIIDEAHMLTREAFNALLKTLEEPPEHVIFILATTEAHKLPETIISRTQRFTFKPIEAEKAVERLAEIAKNEKFNISKDALKLIAEHSGGSFRDSISLLDQVASGSKSVTKEDVEKVLGIAPEAAVNRLEKVLVDGTAQDVIALLGELNEQGFHAGQLAKQLAERLRRSLLEGSVHLQPAILTQTLDRLLGVTASHDPNSALEIALLDVVLQNDHEPSVVNHKAGTLSSESDVAKKSKNNEPTKKAQSLKQEVQGTATPSEIWPKALDAIKSRHNTLYSIARMAVPTFEGNTLTLSFGFPFHQKRMNETKNVILVREIINEITGQPIEVISTVDPGQKNKISVVKPEVKPVDEGSLGAISNIFGGAEVLE